MLKTTLYAYKLTPDLKNSIKDCIISLHYRKVDLIEFIKACNLTTSDLKNISDDQTKSAIIDQMYTNLSHRTDQGMLQIKTMIDLLIHWSDYDSYWFEQGKLDKESAKRKVENLKKILGEKTKQDEEIQKRNEREKKQKKVQEEVKNLEQLNTLFVQLCKMPELSQKRGYELEKLLIALFKVNNIECDSSFKLTGEQIDGSFNFLGNNYIFEAKWQDKQSAANDLYFFAFKIESNTLYPRGIFLSIEGYTSEALERITHNKKPQLVLLDAADLIWVLEGRISLSELLKLKIKHAQTKGEIFVNILQLLK